MYIARILYPVLNLGPGRRLGVWVSGCKRNCKGCANPELHVQRPEQQISMDQFRFIVDMLEEKPKAITITGGEPFDQAYDLAGLCEWFVQTYGKDILIYTGYTLNELIEKNDEDVKRLLESAAAIVDGEYFEELNSGNKIKGSENQRLYVFRKEYESAYTALDTTCEIRSVQPFLCHDGSVVVTGFEKHNFCTDFSQNLQSKVNNGGYDE